MVGVTTIAFAWMMNSTGKALKGHVALPSLPATPNPLRSPSTGDVSIVQLGKLRLGEIKQIALSFENTRQRWDSEHRSNSQTHDLSLLRTKSSRPGNRGRCSHLLTMTVPAP